MKLKTTELQGAVLDWAVAKCEGQVSDSARFMAIFTHQNKTKRGYCWSTDWALAGPIIERENISVLYRVGVRLIANIDGKHEQVIANRHPGNAQLIVAMRCYVASKLGDEVEVPDEIL